MNLPNKINEQTRGYIVIFFGFFGFFIWASFFPLNDGVAGDGYITNEFEKVQIIAPGNGLIKKLNVRNGSKVEKDQILFEYDLSIIDSKIKSTSSKLNGLIKSNESLNNSLKNKKKQVDILKIQYEKNKTLVESRFISEAALLSIEGLIFDSEAEVSNIESKFLSNKEEILSLEEEIQSLKNQKDMQKVKSPIDGLIMNLSIKSDNINVSTAQPLMEISSEDTNLSVYVKFPVSVANKLQKDQKVEVLFPTLLGSKTKKVNGRLVYISGDKIDHERNNQVFIEGLVDLNGVKNILDEELRPGIPAQVIVVTGNRTLLSYIVRPVVDRLNKGLK